MRPIIGVTGYYHPYTTQVSGIFVGEGYTNALAHEGAIPFAIPYLDSEDDLRALAERLDGLLLSGGQDMDPQYFGEHPVPRIGNVSPERDRMEQVLFEEMQRQGKPVLGICRGAQVINVLLGGTLYQDLESQYDGTLIAHDQTAPRWYGTHDVTITEGSQLHQIFGETRIRTNSMHHQSVKEPAPGLVVSAVTEDGVVEAVERPNGPYCIGVQWHPENMWRKDAQFLKLFRSFVEAARTSVGVEK